MIIFLWGWCCCWWTKCLTWRREISGCGETSKTSSSSSSKPRMETPLTGAMDTCTHASWLVFLLSVQRQTFVFASLQENRGSCRVHDLAGASVWLCEEIQVMVACVLSVLKYIWFWFFFWLGFWLLRDSYWPNGILAETPPRRDKSLRMRTRVAAKTTLLGIMPGTHNDDSEQTKQNNVFY